MHRLLPVAAAGGVVMFLFCGSAVADGPPPFTLTQAVSLALKGNGELRVMKEEKGILAAQHLTATALPNPLLELEGSSGATFGSSEDYGVSVGISQEFVTAGKLAKRRAINDRSLEAYHWQLADRERLLIEEVTVAYRELQFGEQRWKLAVKAHDLSRELFAVATQRFTAGDIPELELNLAKVEVVRSEGGILAAEQELLPARTRLANLLGTEGAAGVKVEQMREELSLPSLPLSDLLEGLPQRRPDLLALTAERERGRAEEESARTERIPNITATLFYRHDEMTFQIDRQQGLKRDDTLGLRFSIPLPLLDQNQGRIGEARARISRSDGEIETALAIIRREVVTAHDRLQGSAKLLTLYSRKILPQLEENLRLIREAYQLGEVGILSVIQEQRKFLELRDGQLTELKNGLITQARLEAAAGINNAVVADRRPPLPITTGGSP
jgi:outer membrane protein, heavy metal efflux system